jgi:hypothetical protein
MWHTNTLQMRGSLRVYQKLDHKKLPNQKKRNILKNNLKRVKERIQKMKSRHLHPLKKNKQSIIFHIKNY